MERIADIRQKSTGQMVGLIRPSAKRTRFYLDNEYVKNGFMEAFPHSVTSVYCVLACHANHKRQTCYPSMERIMKLSGITNRNTAFDAIKILQAYRIIAIGSSKGRTSNNYALLRPSNWTSLNDLSLDTVRRQTNTKRTVSIRNIQQSQNKPLNSSTDETLSHRRSSDNEVRGEIPNTDTTDKGKVGKAMPRALLLTLGSQFEEPDIRRAYDELTKQGAANPSRFEVKTLLEEWVLQGQITAKK